MPNIITKTPVCSENMSVTMPGFGVVPDYGKFTALIYAWWKGSVNCLFFIIKCFIFYLYFIF